MSSCDWMCKEWFHAYEISTKYSWAGSKVCWKTYKPKANEKLVSQLGDNCIQNFHLGRYIVGYTVGNLVLMHFCSFVSNRSFESPMKRHVIQRNMTLLMTSNYYLQNITGYTVANFWRYPIRCRVTKASALECKTYADWKPFQHKIKRYVNVTAQKGSIWTY